MDTLKRIENMRSRAISWLNSMKIDEYGCDVFANSEYNKDIKNKDMLLAGTYNAVMCLKLLRAYENTPQSEKDKTCEYINGFQKRNGFYAMPSMRKKDVYYPTMEYDNFHITNYAVRAVRELGSSQKYPFRFLSEYSSIKKLDRWLSKRDMSSPWTEGNYMVNLASFLIMDSEGNKELIENLIEWHNAMQDESGFWMDPERTDLISGMAGAAHNYHIYYYYNLPVPNYKNIVDNCLNMIKDGVSSACLDIDVTDVLCHFIKYGYRTEEIKKYLEAKLNQILDYQNEDGGFSDVDEGIRKFDGWDAYQEPQGISNCFATWFRCASVGMIACCLYPETKDSWNFAQDIGIGYFNKDYIDGVNMTELSAEKTQAKEIWKSSAKKNNKVRVRKSNITMDELKELVNMRFGGKDLSSIEQAVCVKFKITSGCEGEISVLIDHKSAAICDGCESNIEFIAPDYIIKRIMNGKLNPVVAYATKRLAIKGDITKVLKLQNFFF